MRPETKASLQKWFVRLYIPALMLILTAGMLFVLKFGYTPVPPVVMAPSFFDQPEQIGAVAARRFFAEIRENKTIFFGSPIEPAYHRTLLEGFLEAAAKDGSPFTTIIAENQMPELKTTAQIIRVNTNTESEAELIDAIQKAEAEGKHTLVYVPASFSTHVLRGNPINRIEKTLGRVFFSITTSPLALAHDQEYVVDPPCLGSERDNMGTSDLGCAILAAGRSVYRDLAKKNIKADRGPHAENQSRWVAMMNQPAQTQDYLLMISYPGQDKGNAAQNKEIRMNPPGGAGGPIR